MSGLSNWGTRAALDFTAHINILSYPKLYVNALVSFLKDLDDMAKRKSLTLPGLELRPSVVASQSLYGLRFPGSCVGMRLR
jgi:hypothetical protein